MTKFKLYEDILSRSWNRYFYDVEANTIEEAVDQNVWTTAEAEQNIRHDYHSIKSLTLRKVEDMYLENGDEVIEVSLVNYLCPVCRNIAEEGIIMNSLLSEEAAKEVKSLHGKTVGYSDHACKECAKYKDEALFIIGIDAEKSEKEPWRTGDITGINKDCPLALHIKPNTRTLKDGTTYCFMDKALGIELGLWK